MAAPVTHFEVNAKDAARVREFFSSLFGWKIEMDPSMNYGMVNTGVKMGINGGIGQAMGPGASVTFYVQVEDVQAHIDKAVSLGGRVVVPLTDAGMVTFAQIADPEGNVIGLVKGPQTPPPEPKPKKASAKKRKAAKPKRTARRGKRR
ncbi:MAG TPA: VOC family protein [Candidatus Acidoferrales bacterium]|nr:VOC family protein [Candidatus Acidoferrales bacterium]